MHWCWEVVFGIPRRLAQLEQALTQTKMLFSAGGAAIPKTFIKPAVPASQWSLWKEAYDLMDLAGTGHVTLKALVRSNDIWAEGCDLVCQIVGGSKVGQEPGFSKEELLGRPGVPLVIFSEQNYASSFLYAFVPTFLYRYYMQLIFVWRDLAFHPEAIKQFKSQLRSSMTWNARFLLRMLDLSGCRVRKETLLAGRLC